MVTYNPFQVVLGLGFDCYSFRRLPARELCEDFALKTPPNKNSISTFFKVFSILSWPFLQSLGRVLSMLGLCVHKGMN